MRKTVREGLGQGGLASSNGFADQFVPFGSAGSKIVISVHMFRFRNADCHNIMNSTPPSNGATLSTSIQASPMKRSGNWLLAAPLFCSSYHNVGVVMYIWPGESEVTRVYSSPQMAPVPNGHYLPPSIVESGCSPSLGGRMRSWPLRGTALRFTR